jgi:FixJ family two-component response regulator
MSTVSKKFYELLQKNGIQLTSFMRGQGLHASVEDLEKLWERGALEFIDKPPVSIHEVLERACGRSSTPEDWIKLREEILQRGVITRAQD